jgi:excisionase family DNA binding protein
MEWGLIPMTTPQPAPLLWSPAEAAKRLGLSRAGLYELLTRGELASLKVGRRRLIPDEECRRFIAARLAESAER